MPAPVVLLVEDDADDARLALRVLGEGPIALRLEHVVDGPAALERLADRSRPRPRLVVLDLKMPRMSGADVLERIRQDPTTADLVVVMLTSSREREDVRSCYRQGVNGYVVKPVDFREYRTALTALRRYWIDVDDAEQRPDGPAADAPRGSILASE